MLFALLVLLGMAFWRQPSVLRIYVPPDLSRPQFIDPGEIPPSYVYAFSKILMEKLNYCAEAVSYTHLDVYKRQPDNRRWGLDEPGTCRLSRSSAHA